MNNSVAKKLLVLLITFSLNFIVNSQDIQLLESQGVSPPSIEEFKKTITLFSTDSLIKKGTTFFLQSLVWEGEFKELLLGYARELFTESINRGNELEYSYAWRGQIYYLFDEYKLALYDFVKESELNDKIAKPFEMKGQCKARLNDLYGAINDFNIALSKPDSKPLQANIYETRGYCYYQVENISQALIDLNKSIELDKKNGSTYIYRGLCFIIKEEKDKACLDFSKAGELGLSEAYELIEKFCTW